MDGLFFFGGYQRKRGQYFNDLFYFDLDKKLWQTIQTEGTPPSPRTDHTAVLYEGSMYVFAGYDGHTRFNDLWRCSLKQHKYKWRQVQTEGNQPLNRFGHVAVVCQNSMYVIGGWNGHDTMDDIYQFSFRKLILFLTMQRQTCGSKSAA
jgi:N-acetylneuraminic acid mutarotase